MIEEAIAQGDSRRASIDGEGGGIESHRFA